MTFNQGPKGLEPVYGRFMRDVITQVQGVWRIRMDEQRLVAAVQREGGKTWFEVLDFSQGHSPEHVTGVGDGLDEEEEEEETSEP